MLSDANAYAWPCLEAYHMVCAHTAIEDANLLLMLDAASLAWQNWGAAVLTM